MRPVLHMARRKKNKRTEAATALPERLALSLLSPGSLLGPIGGPLPPTPADGTANPTISGAMSDLGSAASQAQHSPPGATAENILSNGSASSAVAPPTKP
jgi:hypothetical protein